MNNEEMAKTDYSVHIWFDERTGLKRADGKLETHDWAIDHALAADSVKLRLECETEIEINLKPRRLMPGY